MLNDTARRVLVVDDDDNIQMLLTNVLEDEGFDVTTAPNGARALELVREQHPQLILLDMMMPVMDGMAFARAYEQLPQPHAPVVVMTASGTAAEEAASLPVVREVMRKPFDVEQIVDRAHKYARP